MRILLLGPPGSGKGTQGGLLAAASGVPHVSTGAMLRESAAAGSPLGLAAKALIDRGEFVPDDVALALVEERLARADAAMGYILDGFPRTLAQAGALDALLGCRGESLDLAVEIVVDAGALLDRIRARAAAAKAAGEAARADDTPETLAERLAIYAERTAPIAGHYARWGRLARIDGMAAPPLVARAVLAAVGRRMAA